MIFISLFLFVSCDKIKIGNYNKTKTKTKTVEKTEDEEPEKTEEEIIKEMREKLIGKWEQTDGKKINEVLEFTDKGQATVTKGTRILKGVFNVLAKNELELILSDIVEPEGWPKEERGKKSKKKVDWKRNVRFVFLDENLILGPKDSARNYKRIY